MNKVLTLLSLLFATCVMAQIQNTEINQTLIGLGELAVDVDGDQVDDLNFEILTVGMGELAARVHPLNGAMILDNSTYGYPDALFIDVEVAGNFTYNTGVLGTFTNAGQFNGMGDRYLGLFLSGYYYGWVKLNCSADRDTIQIKNAAYNTTPFAAILAGQTVSETSVQTSSEYSFTVYPNPTHGNITISGNGFRTFVYNIYSAMGTLLMSGQTVSTILMEEIKCPGIYVLEISDGKQLWKEKIIVQ